MKIQKAKKLLLPLLTALALFTASCSMTGDKDPAEDLSKSAAEKDSQEQSQPESEESDSSSSPDAANQYGSFAEAHDAFQTKLVRQDSDDDSIPEPPDNFELISYPSKVGDLSAYVSSDPGDGQKHPLIIWIVGGWGNGIDDFPWTYPQWDDDQTGSAFWQAGVLTMYPSFRGGCGNPAYYEALFGEIDDIVSAYEYAASLPYVDPERIYLGGHSTGATRALLTAEYTDKFRAVFGFGAVDEIKYHNNSQFTFDTSIEEEFIMRSPIHWLDDVKTPTFLIEGSEGNSANLKNIEKTSRNENIHCYVVDGTDHWGVLAPITPLLAQKILADTGAESNISITQEELEAAMKQEPTVPLPAMSEWILEDLYEEKDLVFSLPYTWSVTNTSTEEEFQLDAYSIYEGENVWDLASLFINVYILDESDYLQTLADSLESEEGFETSMITVNGMPALDSYGMSSDDGSVYKNRYVVIQSGNAYICFDFYIHESFDNDADEMFQSIVDTIRFE